MFALRKINNNYSDFAGTRSDFVVVGHPEFNSGKVVEEWPSGWDTTPIKSKPKRSLPGDRMMRNGGHRELIRRIAGSESRPGYKERALAREKSEPGLLRQPRTQDRHGMDLDSFIAALDRPGKLPPCSPHRITAGYANHISSQPVCKYYESMQGELGDLKARLQVAPEETRAELASSDSWRYYADRLEQAQRNGAKLDRERRRQESVLRSTMPAAR